MEFIKGNEMNTTLYTDNEKALMTIIEQSLTDYDDKTNEELDETKEELDETKEELEEKDKENIELQEELEEKDKELEEKDKELKKLSLQKIALKRVINLIKDEIEGLRNTPILYAEFINP